MLNSVSQIFRFIMSLFKTRTGLQAENIALRHQLCVFQRSVTRPKIRPTDRILWSILSRYWPDWREALLFVKPDIVIRWQRKRFREHWSRLSRNGKSGRPTISKEIKELIRTLSTMNPTWGSPHIVGELGKIGIVVAKSTVEKYMAKLLKESFQRNRIHRLHRGTNGAIYNALRIDILVGR